jgi:GntR family transcriptional regulator
MTHPTPLRREALARPQLAGPLYFQIQQLIRDRILSKEWQEGQPLPNETDLASAYGVSVGTMRKALDLLTQAKVIVRRQGLGTFVNGRRDDPPSRFRRWVSGDKLVAETDHDVLERQFTQPSSEEARLLRIAGQTPVARITVRTSVDHAGAALDHYVISAAQAPGLDDFMIGTGPNFETHLEKLEAAIPRCDDRLNAQPAPPGVAHALELGASNPVLVVERVAFGRDDSPIFLCRRYIAASHAHYQVVTE